MLEECRLSGYNSHHRPTHEKGVSMTRNQFSSFRNCSRLRSLCLCLVALIVLADLAPQSALGAVINLCRATSLAALLSCRAGAQSDYWLAFGKCDNLVNPAERIVCRRQALTALREANSLCEERFNARQ